MGQPKHDVLGWVGASAAKVGHKCFTVRYKYASAESDSKSTWANQNANAFRWVGACECLYSVQLVAVK